MPLGEGVPFCRCRTEVINVVPKLEVPTVQLRPMGAKFQGFVPQSMALPWKNVRPF